MSFDFRDSTALFGGSFHPPHLGHTQAIEGLFRNPAVKKVIILPSFGTPLKKVAVSFENRMEMAKLAFSHIPNIKISDFEFKHQTQYTWQLLDQFSSQVKNPVFVIGTDQFQKLDQWAKFPEVLGMSDWIVLLRKPTTLDHLKNVIQKYVQDQILKPTINDHEFMAMGKRLMFVTTEAMEVSSTRLREQISLHQWESVESFMSPQVKDYILRNKIYGK
jgi:nicotinate-nucleotide adenylyltransferase